MRDISDLLDTIEKGDQRAELALKMFGYRVKKYIGSYMAALGHVDAIVFEGGIGETIQLLYLHVTRLKKKYEQIKNLKIR